jgi:hypothetical protein
MKSNAYALASPRPSASRTKREVAAIFGLEDAQVEGELVRARMKAYRARRRRQSDLAADDGGSEPDFQLGGGGQRAGGERNGDEGPKGKHAQRLRTYLEPPSGARTRTSPNLQTLRPGLASS